jgi:hypothetical protein
MGKSWREWSKYTSKTPRKRNRSSVAHCCKLHHDWDARAYDELRDGREGKKEHLKEIKLALKGEYT